MDTGDRPRRGIFSQLAIYGGWAIALVFGLLLVFLPGTADLWSKLSLILSAVALVVTCLITYFLADRHESSAKEAERRSEAFFEKASEKLHSIESIARGIQESTSAVVNRFLERVLGDLATESRGRTTSATKPEGLTTPAGDVIARDGQSTTIPHKTMQAQDVIPRAGQSSFHSGDGKDYVMENDGSVLNRAVVIDQRQLPGWPPPPPGSRWIAHRWPITEDEARSGPKIDFRRILDLPTSLVPGTIKGLFYVRVDDYLALEINGRFVGLFVGSEKVHEQDISRFLRGGSNELIMELTNRKGAPNEGPQQNPMGFCYRIDAEYQYYETG